MTELRPLGEGDILLAVDVQNDFCPGGALAVPRGDEVVPLINRLAQRFAHVVLTQDWHPRGHHSFASTHSGQKPYDTIAVAYGPQNPLARSLHSGGTWRGPATGPAADSTPRW